MLPKEKIIVGLEVGTSKVCAVVGEVLDDGNIMVIGVGQANSEGVRKGEIINIDAAVECIHAAVADAEESAGVEIHNVYASVSGGHIRSFNNRGTVAVTNDDREITEEEVRSVLLNAKAVNIPMDHVVIHAIRQHFFVDGHDGIQNPVGMIGAKLEADVHVIHGVRTRLQNTIKCIKHVPLDVANIAVSGFASALAVLTSEHQQLGAIVIDMGGGTTDYMVYSEGTIQHSGVLAVGGDHVTNDVAIGLRIPMNRAETLKVEQGSVEIPSEDEIIALKREVGLPDRHVSRQQLCRIMNLRVEETLGLVKKELEKQKLLDYLGAGVFITGGCARLRGLESLATQVFGLPVHIGHSLTVGGPTSAIESPEYSTAIGLVRYALGSQRDQHQPPSPLRKMGQSFYQLIQKVRTFL
ncbi:MAG TPA: cell division protein FtsA [Verrucomicrobiae bacterium]|nr:cell division protein FtsA [Verrucomicrobiae bacterium]